MSPLAWPIAAALAHFDGVAGVPAVADIDRALGARAGVRFVEAAPKPRHRGGSMSPSGRTLDRSALYDARIVTQREVPTRPGNLHDFMNALVWASFPRAKMAIHERQHALIQSRIEGDRLPARRTPEQDTLAMIDEGGIALCTTEAERLERATQDRDGDALRRLVQSGLVAATVFGHALFEHMAKKGAATIWGRAVILPVSALALPIHEAEIDARLSEAVRLRRADHDAGSAPLVPSVLLSI